MTTQKPNINKADYPKVAAIHSDQTFPLKGIMLYLAAMLPVFKIDTIIIVSKCLHKKRSHKQGWLEESPSV